MVARCLAPISIAQDAMHVIVMHTHHIFEVISYYIFIYKKFTVSSIDVLLDYSKRTGKQRSFIGWR
jgi:hypothetical protein